jgi:orotate phosphoribosyltransferase
MDKNELGRKIFDVSHLTGEFLLRSGAISNEYFDKYRFESKPLLLKAIAEKMTDLLPEKFDILAGLEMGGIPLATAISLQTGIETVLVRKKAKDYGTRNTAEGASVDGKRVVVIEDVVTSGGQIVLSVEDLRKAGAIIDTALCVIDRESGGKDNLAKAGIELKALFTMTELKSLA